ncbi:DUF3025 domain-containing protein [Rhodoferax lacus]|uniref:DUF3025 domain-containing protein n=1 Tax=Rhodoferax lacus TaxID=2184758 RepID=A0A3E1RAC2_9BURK|nr:DUF3025 domain-containing protein [Rhodoferax lacus]RFO95982.1 DUF3025 domain-containing protein [Rhodoferax lacus]
MGERGGCELSQIDWDAPWLSVWRSPGEAVAQQVAAGLSVAQALNATGLAPKRFIPQAELPAGVAYEAHIFAAGCVPTRDGLHDFFNGLAWLHFPQTKLRLNALQAAQIASSGIQPVRGPARDALTVFDENAALLQAPDALWNALVAKDWPAVFVTLRPLWAQSHLILFGHALTEKLVAPRKPITAHVYRVHAPGRGLADIDAWLACELSADVLAAKPFAHLPVLGVPGWWAANESPAFYDDPSVFRALRQSP